MKINMSLLFLLLFVFSEISLAAGYKVQIYNGTGQTIDILPGTNPILKPWFDGLVKCKWANTNFDMGNYDNWSDSTHSAWFQSINTARTVRDGKHRSFWCRDSRPERWERMFQVRVDCDGDGSSHYKASELFARTHLRHHANYVFTLSASHCLPN